MAQKQSGPNPTMTDVAHLAEVSQSTVSLVLNESPGARIPEATRQRVLNAAKKLEYRLPTPRTGRNSRSKATGQPKHSIAFVIDELSVGPHAVLQLDGARNAAWGHRYTVKAYVTRGNSSLEEATIDEIVADPTIAGVVYASSFTRAVTVPDRLRDLPTVLVNCYSTGAAFPTFLVDDFVGGYAAAQYMLAYGLKRIGVISGERWMDASQERLRGYRKALEEASIPFDAGLVRWGDWEVDSGYRRTMSLMRQGVPPTAIYCANDLMALGCFNALAELWLSVPDDVSVVGHNDLQFAAHTHPPLSSCRPPNYEMGEQAVEHIIDQALGHDTVEPTTTRLECKLVVRSSVSFRQRDDKPVVRRRPAAKSAAIGA